LLQVGQTSAEAEFGHSIRIGGHTVVVPNQYLRQINTTARLVTELAFAPLRPKAKMCGTPNSGISYTIKQPSRLGWLRTRIIVPYGAMISSFVRAAQAGLKSATEREASCVAIQSGRLLDWYRNAGIRRTAHLGFGPKRANANSLPVGRCVDLAQVLIRYDNGVAADADACDRTQLRQRFDQPESQPADAVSARNCASVPRESEYAFGGKIGENWSLRWVSVALKVPCPG